MTSASIRWRMPLLVRVTLVLHAVMLVALVLMTESWKWVLATFVVNHLVLTFAGLWPRSTWLGPNWTMLPPASIARREIALTIDDGPNPDVTPKVLDLLDRYGVKATFFCIGTQAARYPELCRQIVERGHAVENHSQHHRHHFSLLGPKGFAREIEAGQDTLTAITGRRPQFFRAPAGLRNPFLDPVLARLGLRLAAWTRRGFDTRTGDPAIVLSRLLPDVRPGAILLLHDGNCARTSTGEPVILAVLPPLIEAAQTAGLRFVTLSSALHATRP
ncbi:polysaccharide deacetylase family protein [Noviherbaspirillum agri]